MHAAQWSRLSELVAQTLGLHFPRERWADLHRGLAEAARELGEADVPTCIHRLLSSPPTRAQLQVLGSHLTVGETYFFREPRTLEAFATAVLPALAAERRGRERRIRLWSAACSSGEEPYTLAILLHRLLPDLGDWRITITATDVNPRALRKAAAGVYGEWSFRNAPAWLKASYFEQVAEGRYAVLPQIRAMVRFAHLNLAEDHYPALETDTNAMDAVFCRNVLMYFTPTHIRKVAEKLHHAVVDGGWLAVAPSEASRESFPQFTPVNFDGAILFRKLATRAPAPVPVAVPLPDVRAPTYSWPPPVAAPAPPVEAPPPVEALYRAGRYSEASDALEASVAGGGADPGALSMLVHALANQGRLPEALAWCDRGIAARKLDAAIHYLRAVVLLELGEREAARAALLRATFLEPGFVLAHYALGNLARDRGRPAEAQRHFANALQLLRACDPEERVPEAEGLTAGRLVEFIAALTPAGGTDGA